MRDEDSDYISAKLVEENCAKRKPRKGEDGFMQTELWLDDQSGRKHEQ